MESQRRRGTVRRRRACEVGECTVQFVMPRVAPTYRVVRNLVLAVLVLILGGVLYLRLPRSLRVSTLAVPAGFSIDVYAPDVRGARSMALGDARTVFVGTRGEGLVYAVRDTDGDNVADVVDTVARELHMPNGVAVRDGDLYVAEVGRVLRYAAIEPRTANPPEPVTVLDGLPEENWHGWRYIRFGPDGWLYITVGVPCNICLERGEERFGTILRADLDAGTVEIVARGVRNSVGLDWHPRTGELWFTDNGRDWLGNDAPPDELNRVAEPGAHFGFPYCHGGVLQDEEFDQRDCAEFTPPVQQLDPHVASLGMHFYRGSMFPAVYRGRIFIAEHGSWNRVPPSGYRVTTVTIENGRAVAYEVFADGWLRAGRASGTPADILELPDGSLLVSDDRAGMIYRISYGRP